MPGFQMRRLWPRDMQNLLRATQQGWDRVWTRTWLSSAQHTGSNGRHCPQKATTNGKEQEGCLQRAEVCLLLPASPIPSRSPTRPTIMAEKWSLCLCSRPLPALLLLPSVFLPCVSVSDVPTPSHRHLTHSALSFKKSLPHPYIPLQLRPLPPSLLSPTYQVASVSLPPTHSSTHSNLLVGPLLVTTLTGPPRPPLCCTTPRCFCSPPLIPALSRHIDALGLFQQGTPRATPSSKVFLV